MRILLDPPVSGLNHANLCLLYPSLHRQPCLSCFIVNHAVESDEDCRGFIGDYFRLF